MTVWWLSKDHSELGKRDDIIVLPEPVAERLGVEVGETVLIRLETLTGQQNVGEARVAAFIKDQEELGLSAAYTSRANLNSLLGMEPHEYQILNMFVTDLDLVDQFAGLSGKAAQPRGSGRGRG